MMKDCSEVPSPILITGSHRSGTTWAGTILSSAPQTVLIREPFSPLHRPGIFAKEIPHWYQYLDTETGEAFVDSYREMLCFRYGFRREMKAIRSFKDVGRMVRDSFEMSRARFGTSYKAIVKDPLALLSTKWIIDQFQSKAVILVRHPAAFVSSLKRVEWKMSFKNFIAQPALMDAYLTPFRSEIERALENPSSLITRGALLWKILYSVVQEHFSTHPGVRIVRHEDLSVNPLEQYEKLFQWLGLAYTRAVVERINKYSSSQNPKEARGNKVFELKRNSAASINLWKQKLSAEEIDTVFRITAPVLEYYYPEIPSDYLSNPRDDE